MRCVVTGGAGFIGSHLCDALIKRGDEVLCVDNLAGTHGSARNIEHLLGAPGFSFVQADVVEWAIHEHLLDVDIVFHEAAAKCTVCLEDPERDLRTNGLGTLRLVRAAALAGVRKFVHASTGSVLDGRPASYYGISKLAGENYVRVAGDLLGLDWTVLRYYNVIGPRQDGSGTGGVVPIFVRHALAGEPITIFGTGHQTRSFTSVGDVVAANLLVASAPAARDHVFACGSGIHVSIIELAEYIRDRVRSVPVRFEPRRPGDVDAFTVDNAALLTLGARFQRNWRAVVDGVIAYERAA